jgi:hypothetical protein
MSSLEEKRARRRQLDVLSVIALAKLLRDAVSNPAKYLSNQTFAAALRSQGALAKYSESSSIVPMSLNHQRVIAEAAVGGFDVLDRLRKEAANAIAGESIRQERGNARTKQGLIARVRELEGQVALLKQDLLLLQRAYDTRCVQARNYAAAAPPAIRALCAKEQTELNAMFSLRRSVLVPSRVTSIGEARGHVRPSK